MKRINLKGLREVLSEKELKNVMGGSGGEAGCWKCVCSDDTTFYRAYPQDCIDQCTHLDECTKAIDPC